jgi:hypothetical protein
LRLRAWNALMEHGHCVTTRPFVAALDMVGVLLPVHSRLERVCCDPASIVRLPINHF